MTMKQIAITISRSPKAVEHILEAVKVKLKCYSRSELIATALNLPYIMNKLFNSIHYAINSDFCVLNGST